MKRKNSLKNILFMVALAIGGAIFSTTILTYVAKIPVLSSIVDSLKSTVTTS